MCVSCGGYSHASLNILFEGNEYCPDCAGLMGMEDDSQFDDPFGDDTPTREEEAPDEENGDTDDES